MFFVCSIIEHYIVAELVVQLMLRFDDAAHFKMAPSLPAVLRLALFTTCYTIISDICLQLGALKLICSFGT